METRDYIQPKIKMLNSCGRRSLLQGMHVGGTVNDEGDIGFSKRNDFEFEDNPTPRYNVWGDE